jgi:hypothetical protein
MQLDHPTTPTSPGQADRRRAAVRSPPPVSLSTHRDPAADPAAASGRPVIAMPSGIKNKERSHPVPSAVRDHVTTSAARLLARDRGEVPPWMGVGGDGVLSPPACRHQLLEVGQAGVPHRCAAIARRPT